MILALLLAQGLRVCVHGASEKDAFGAATQVAHFEANLVADDGDSAEKISWHTPFSIILKLLQIKFELLAVAVALLILPLALQVVRLAAPSVTSAPPLSSYALRPLLRAPPA